MATNVRKWGNSLGVRIPKPLAEQLGLECGSSVELVVRDGELVLRPIVPRRYRLPDLLDRIDHANLHREAETGEAVGREAW